MKFRKLLVANRGEIACRVMRTARDLGYTTVAVFSDADRQALHVRMADEAVYIGGSEAKDSYLNIAAILQAAHQSGADAVHPGYGVLSEQPALCELLEEEGIAWVGPRPETLRAVGDKGSARQVAIDAGVPVGAGVEIDDPTNVVALGEQIGYPLLIKAIHGGGGRGIRLVTNPEELVELAPQAAAEAVAAFGNGALYLERYYGRARHVEVQVFGDGEGNAWIFGDRDCSVQRRHQKLIEECPAPGLSEKRRQLLHDSSRALVTVLRYRGAGTVEFLVDTESEDVIFLEVNARIQVEHPVTEEAFGVDLVAAQLLLALGRDPQLPDVGPVPPAAVIEMRINAEDPNADFQPNSGDITRLVWPQGPGIRIDTFVEDGATVPPFYDSMIAKLIVTAPTREAALNRAARALDEFVIEGIPTTIPLLREIVDEPTFRAGRYTTTYIDEVGPSLATLGEA
jgi:acetyl-CoA carboxylase biotin carboxylase subunit